MRKTSSKILKGAALGLIIGLAISFTFISAKFGLQGRLPPGTIIADVNVGYDLPEEAVTILKEKKEKYLRTPFEFTLKTPQENKTAKIFQQDISLQYFTIETVSTIDRMDFRKSSLQQELQKAKREGSMEILYALDVEKLIKKLDEELDLQKIAPQNAAYFINDESKLDITEERSGLLIDYDKAINEVKSAVAYMRPVELTLEFREAAPTITKAHLEDQKDKIAENLRHTVTMTYEDSNDTWEFLPIHHLDGIEFVETNSITLPYVDLKIDLADKYLPESFEGSEKTTTIVVTEEKLDKFLDTFVVEDVEIEVDPVSIY